MYREKSFYTVLRRLIIFQPIQKPLRLSIFAGFSDYSPLVKGLNTIILHKTIEDQSSFNTLRTGDADLHF